MPAYTAVKIETAEQFNAEITRIKDVFQEKETEHTWGGFEEALRSLVSMTREGAFNKYEREFLAALKALRTPILNSIATERTRLSGTAVELVEEISKAMGKRFVPYCELFLPSVMKLCARTNKVFISRGKSCVNSIIKNVNSPVIIPKFKEALQDQSKSLRACAAEWLLACVEFLEVGDLTDYVDDLEVVIRQGVLDSASDVRSVCKKLYEAYKSKFDLRVPEFQGSLSPTAKKYLGIREKQPVKRPRPFRSATDGSYVLSKPSVEIPILNDMPILKEEESASKESTAFVISFDEPKPETKMPTLSSAQRVQTAPEQKSAAAPPPPAPMPSTPISSAQRVPSKPSRQQTAPIPSVKSQQASNAVTGGALRVKAREPVSNTNDEKAKAMRVLNQSYEQNQDGPLKKPPLTRSVSSQATEPVSKAKTAAKSASAPLSAISLQNNESSVHAKENQPPVRSKANKLSAQSKENMLPTRSKRNLDTTRARPHRFIPYKKQSPRADRRHWKRAIPPDSALAKRQVYSMKLAAEKKAADAERLERKKKRTSRILKTVVHSPVKKQQHLKLDPDPAPSAPAPRLPFIHPVKFVDEVNAAGESAN